MNIESLLLYLLTWLLVALTPGPAVICIMSQAARYGTKARIPWSCGHTNWQPHFFPVYRVRAGDTIGSRH
jgi:threonine/homoserine/homoserine lactone efflux protein